jgi:hypothetical protein
MSVVPSHSLPECKCTPLLSQACLYVPHGGVSLRFDNSACYNTLRFSFLVDASSCKQSPQSLFSIAAGRGVHLSAVAQACAYPAADGRARLTLQLCEKSFSTCFTCGHWLTAQLRITDSLARCASCSHTVANSVSQFTLSITIGDDSFIISSDFPQNHFRGALQLGSRAPDAAPQPAVFRSIFAEVSPHICARCSVALPAHASCVVEPGFSARLPLRCGALDVEGVRCRPSPRIAGSRSTRSADVGTSASASFLVRQAAQ